MPTPEVELEGAMDTASSMTLMEKLVVGLLSLMSTSFLVILGVAIRRKNKEQGAEDLVWVMTNKTIERLNNEVNVLKEEINLVTSQKNQFEVAVQHAQARAELANRAAEVASKAASDSVTELQLLRKNWIKVQAYLFLLKETLAKNNIEIPAEPELE